MNSKFGADITGLRFGRLIAQWPAGTAGSAAHPKIVWLYLCDCGSLKFARRSNVVSGHVRSCGCYARESRLRCRRTHGLRFSPQYSMWYDAKKRAEAKNIPFNITPQDIVIPKICPLLRIRLFPSKGQPGRNSPSLDRIKPARGYVKGNIRVISYKANSMKSDSTLKEFERLARNWRKLCE